MFGEFAHLSSKVILILLLFSRSQTRSSHLVGNWFQLVSDTIAHKSRHAGRLLNLARIAERKLLSAKLLVNITDLYTVERLTRLHMSSSTLVLRRLLLSLTCRTSLHFARCFAVSIGTICSALLCPVVFCLFANTTIYIIFQLIFHLSFLDAVVALFQKSAIFSSHDDDDDAADTMKMF